MPRNAQSTPNWPSRRYVSLEEAAAILARPPSWIRSQITIGRIETGPRLWPLEITSASLIKLIGTRIARHGAAHQQPAKKARSRRPQHLRLVVNNTAP